MGDWLSTGRIADHERKFRPFEEATNLFSLVLKSETEWRKYCKSGKKPQDIPYKPYRTYKSEWVSWGDWLGTGRIADQDKTYRAFGEAKEFVHTLKLKNRKEWEQYCKSGKKPDDIPADASATYEKHNSNTYD